MNQPPVTYCKRLIEVDLPIKKISEHARREKSIRHGHISTLHIWWARRPLAACRAVICASLWPDPGDPLCPPEFQERAAKALCSFAAKVRSQKHLGDLCQVSGKRWRRTEETSLNGEVRCAWELRYALLEFIADFANWDASNVPEFLEAARAITQAAHEALGGAVGTRPLLIDPFAGGGAIPLEGLRVGADVFASDLNPVAVLLNKVVLEYIPKYGTGLVDGVRRWGQWVREKAESELARFYPKDADGATPVAYLWARTIRCEGPGCGAEVPLIRSLGLARTASRATAFRLVPDKQEKRVAIDILDNVKPKDIGEGVTRRGSATCPVCAYTTKVERVREQLLLRRGGTRDARMTCVVVNRAGQSGRVCRVPNERDLHAVSSATAELERKALATLGRLSLVPNESISFNELRRISVPLYGMLTWGDIFTARQALSLATFGEYVRRAHAEIAKTTNDHVFVEAIATCLGLLVDKQCDRGSSLCRWDLSSAGGRVASTFGRQALPFVSDFVEPPPFGDASGDFGIALEGMVRVLDDVRRGVMTAGQAVNASAGEHPLPDDVAHVTVTDPPYYDAVPYAYLSDFFYVWLRRTLPDIHPTLLASPAVPKEAEIVVDRRHERSSSNKDIAFYESELTRAFSEARRVTRPDGICTVVFASKSTASWEAILQALIDAAWIITGSWPIDTEMETRVAAQGQARLGSSIHIVCRPRENTDGSVRMDDVGDWRDVLTELPKRLHEWMPRLASEGVVGADAIFACLGPALEIFSRYSRVEDAAGDPIKLKTYLEKVWEAVAKEALSVIFSGADAAGFEPDARLTAMWLWTLFSAASTPSPDSGNEDDDVEDEDEPDSKKGKSKGLKGFALEYDAARKIAQGLGAELETLGTLVELKGETARLLSVDERRKALFGKVDAEASETKAKGKKKKGQLALGFKADDVYEAAVGEVGFGVGTGTFEPGATVLDRVHQAMILFGANQGASLKRFLVEDKVGEDNRFWSLADHLSKLYPTSASEKRLVDGVLARKKGLGY